MNGNRPTENDYFSESNQVIVGVFKRFFNIRFEQSIIMTDYLLLLTSLLSFPLLELILGVIASIQSADFVEPRVDRSLIPFPCSRDSCRHLVGGNPH
jgi:hypothetical protein